ncbi:SMP-30/gluconolactonase/LRE family protein [Spirillospora sp. NPDC050679]
MPEVVHPDVVCQLGAGPRWDAAAGVLRWADRDRALLHTAPWDGRARRLEVGRRLPLGWTPALSAVLPVGAPPGGLLAVAGTGLAHLTARGIRPLLPPLVRPGRTRLNDAACDPSGRLWVGAAAADATAGAGLLLRIDAGGVTRVLTGLTVPGGIGWSPDGRVMYLAEGRPGRITAYAFDTRRGVPSRPRALVRLDPREGVPDGLAVDAEGCVWVATWTGRQVRRYSPGGRLLEALDVPAARVTGCAFAGPALDALVVTTGRVGDDPPPESGRLFRFAPGVRGLPARPYLGPLPRSS